MEYYLYDEFYVDSVGDVRYRGYSGSRVPRAAVRRKKKETPQSFTFFKLLDSIAELAASSEKKVRSRAAKQKAVLSSAWNDTPNEKKKSIKKALRLFLSLVFLFVLLFTACYLLGRNAVSSPVSREMLDGGSIPLARVSETVPAPVSQGSVSGSTAAPAPEMPKQSFKGGTASTALLGLRKIGSFFSPVKAACEIEAGTVVSTTDIFTNDGVSAEFITDIRKLDTAVPGMYQIELRSGGKEYESLLFVIDTVAPTATAHSATAYTGTPIEPSAILSDVVDASQLTATYLTMPDFNTPGSYYVTVRLEDACRNFNDYRAIITVADDTEPPVITGAVDRNVCLGDSVSYKEGVTVTDNKDGANVALNVDISAVKPTEPGDYPVTYSATDSTGLTSSVTVTFHFKTTEEQQLEIDLENLVNSVYNSIITDSMSPRDKAYAIYKWTRSNIWYSGDSDKSNWKKEAVKGLKERGGDCFTYFSVAKALLNRAGIDNIDVVKIKRPGRPSHFWSLINIGSGWYHFDATQWVYDDAHLFMITDAKLEAFSNRHRQSHEFDHSLYPATPTTPAE